MLDTVQHLLTNTDLLSSSYLYQHDSSVISALHSQMDIQASLHTNPYLNLHMDLLAQQAKQFNQDVMGDIGKGFNSFVKSGQLTSLVIGIVVGYMFRSITNR